MLDNKYDVVVIGAGPGGSVAARNVAKAGLKTLLLEKRERIGYPVRCGEASTSMKDLQTYGPIDEDCIETIINGLYIYGPNGVNIEVPKPATGIMLNREKFDPWLAKLAADDGAEVVTCARAEFVSDVESAGNDGYRRVRVVLGKGNGDGSVTAESTQEILAKMVIAADGVESRIGRMVGLDCIQKPGMTCNGIDFHVKGMLTRPDYLTFWQGHDFINDGYIWSFPKQKSNMTKFGAGFLIPHKNETIYDVTLEWLHKLFPGAEIDHVVGGVIPVSSVLKDYTLDRFALVGDAAHHTNPLTGGGIAAAMRAGRFCAQTVVEAFKEDNLSKQFLKTYEKRCYDYFGKMHDFEYKFRRFLLELNREDQVGLYKVLQGFALSGYKKSAFLKTPIQTAKYLYKFTKFKA
ncbi:2,3-di-O-geranylgeranylglyceryl phosphate reductase [Fibrobacter sp. UWH9]|uniref:NAD(P)/FAD-dependent oxidoreductase n=1 Tax=unclassified Fibrobacter TaxID=2634177 RepID=UPI000918F994|nr:MULTISPECIES: NAD(P)/FAD-dependent oxidoreductase [Fibrobacter]MCQ2100269.1 NAD(P)/FAD-dependent oxidoreductase [Fibrobacter sp.]MCL4103335.1 3-(3-hydroxy-phenyl)propionate/3-hydroxycinnamic acid hydroxylase [Fibrobacter succinogenes]MDO4947993.1 NAD(P)/FAD-dependent oxidoreductase [Fibrobacter sp.]OWV03022.1 geranylgeranyl reductase [Fibrobacter sp. UWH3]OWV08965.1 geranylgeranyl reductase [Fibrobacter sp. UWH1]